MATKRDPKAPRGPQAKRKPLDRPLVVPEVLPVKRKPNMGRPIARKALDATTIALRRERVASLITRRKTQTQVAQILAEEGLVNPDSGKPWSVATICDDVDKIKAQWLQNSVRDIALVKSEELNAILEMEDEAWQAWERSAALKRMRKDGTLEVTKKFSDGNPAFLQTILHCQQRRAKILGLDVPDRIEDVTKRENPDSLKSSMLSKLLKVQE